MWRPNQKLRSQTQDPVDFSSFHTFSLDFHRVLAKSILLCSKNMRLKNYCGGSFGARIFFFE